MPAAGDRRVAILGALVGLFASAYLLIDYVFGSGICLTGSGCDIVRASSLAYPLGIPMPLYGVGYFVIAVALALTDTAQVGRFRPRRAILMWSLIGLGVMAVLTIVELVVIGAACGWCLLAALASGIFVLGAVRIWRGGSGTQGDAAQSSRARRRRTANTDATRAATRRFAVATASGLGIALVVLITVPLVTSGGATVGTGVSDAGAPTLGAGRHEVVVFSDFQCPACAAAAPLLTELAQEESIQLVYRYFPLASIHGNAVAAARAAEAAAVQDRFWDFHDALFARQTSWSNLSAPDAATAFEQIASEIGLDIGRWRSDAASAAVANDVASDERAAREMQLAGTPTIFIDGVRYLDRVDSDSLRQALDDVGSD